MIQNNQHKYLAKSLCCDSVTPNHYQQSEPINVSRTLGQSKNWIGCGYINKKGIEIDHIDVAFPFYSLVYVIQGEGHYCDENGNRYPLTKGSLFQRRPDKPHTTIIDPNSEWKEYYLDCNQELYQHLCSLSLIDSTIPVYNDKYSQASIDNIEQLMMLLRTTSEETLIDGYLLYLSILRALFSEQDKPIENDAIIELSCRDFEQKYAHRFDIRAYCASKGWGYERFRKTFKKKMGVSPREYLIRKRMDEACKMLRSTSMQISEISQQLGYASQYEFSNQFKKTFHVFPKHYRNGK
ncbi:hypothetical protein MACH09_18580 [Vibrio sp. MACH09]|uniref:helix-turn-helix domain-containing protein n=1 Tax=Vibrio sp. MACH09 TaxID=3025122 RepID=UPI00278E17B5|nr:AraC family transcriptional regulator [Vibrio sp. MACH09]GLO61350.1 hypothetical protein MACH09_18580 [Vibrio sp. MACH09]